MVGAGMCAHMRTPTWQLLSRLDRIHELRLQQSPRIADPAEHGLLDWEAALKDYETENAVSSIRRVHSVRV